MLEEKRPHVLLPKVNPSLLEGPTPVSAPGSYSFKPALFPLDSLFPEVFTTHTSPCKYCLFPLLLRAVASVTNPISSLPTSSSAHSNLASVPMQITVTTVLNAPSHLQTAKSKALTSSSVCVDDANCTSFLSSLLDSQTGEPTY